MHVAILDKAEFPRQKVCAGWVTPAVMEELQVDLNDYRQGRVLQPIHAFQTGLIGRPSVQTRFPGRPISYGIRRIEFDDYLLRRSGARLLLGEPCASMRREGAAWLVNDRYRAPLVVGAGGHFCPVARYVSAKPASETVVAAQEIEFALTPAQRDDCPVAKDTPELYFTPDLKGYGWIFRKGDYLNVGLGREDKSRLAGHVESFCRELQSAGRIPRSLPEKFCGHAYLLYPRASRPPVEDGVLLVGDAAGLAYPQSGEGIRPAVESALLAAQVILQCQGDYTPARLQPYRTMLEARFGKRSPAPGWSERLPAGLKQAAGRIAMRNRWFARHLLTTRWFLHQQEAPLTGVPESVP
jgi:flavin-dependent dehydrogenase